MTDTSSEAVSVLGESECDANSAFDGGRADEPDLASQFDAVSLVNQLNEALDPVDRQIIQLKMEGYTEEEIGMQVGLARENVCRHWQEIRKVAMKLRT